MTRIVTSCLSSAGNKTESSPEGEANHLLSIGFASSSGYDNASSHADYVIDELKSAQLFITALEATFTNHREAEESRQKLQRIRQAKDQLIEEFNMIFNALLFMVDMDSVSNAIYTNQR